MKKCGYIALIGAPNSGKSTLLNALLKKKISIVSNKPQTTRSKILGIATLDNTQLLFLDTPGFVSSRFSDTAVSSRGEVSSRGLTAGSILKSIPWDACQDADVVCYLIDAVRGWHPKDSKHLQKLVTFYNKKVFIIGTKTDKLKKDALRKAHQEFQQNIAILHENLELDPAVEPQDDTAVPRDDTVVQRDDSLRLRAQSNITLLMLSAKKPEDVSSLMSTLSENMPIAEWLYDKNSVTDSSEKFICAEFIREQLFRQLGEELPYQTTVIIDKLEKSEQIVHIYATIIMMRESQKAIVIGRGGARLKKIGQLSRESLEKYLGKKIFLKIFVKKGEL